MDSFDMFIRYVANFSQAITVYRGVTHEDYDLRPKVGRLEKKRKNESLINLEQRILRRFEERAIPYLGACSGVKRPGVRSKPAGLPEQSRPP